jgi:hypothetical protein
MSTTIGEAFIVNQSVVTITHDRCYRAIVIRKNSRRQQARGYLGAQTSSSIATARLAMSSSDDTQITTTASSRKIPSPWSSGKWKVSLDFGRNIDSVEDDRLGKEWGSSGNRLALSFDVLVTSETTTSNDSSSSSSSSSLAKSWLGGKPTGSISCTTNNTVTYINEYGQQYVHIASGQWRIESPIPLTIATKALPGQASTIRAYITLVTAIQRNTIHFPSNQLLLLQANAFRYTQYNTGLSTILPYQHDMEYSQQLVDKQLNHESGDRRLDGVDVLQTLEGYKDIAQLIKVRDDCKRKWKEIKNVLPKQKKNISSNNKQFGLWPGDTELLTIERGVILALVNKRTRKKNSISIMSSLIPWIQQQQEKEDGEATELVEVGTWNAIPVLL